MGPINIALVQLYLAECSLREAQSRLDDVTKNVRLQERKVQDLTTRSKTTEDELKHQQAKAAELDLEVKSRDARIEQLRTQQQTAQTNREYQTFLVEINTQKVDKSKYEEDQLKIMETVEKLSADHKGLVASLETESAKLVTMKSEINTKVKELTAEVDSLRPSREEAAAKVPQKVRDIFDRLANKFEGEAMAPIEKPHPKREEYICSSCNIELTVDVYNRLHSRDEPCMCPSGKHLLYIPTDLPIEKAVHKPKEKTTRKTKKDIGAPIQKQTLASSVVPSIDQDEEDKPQTTGSTETSQA